MKSETHTAIIRPGHFGGAELTLVPLHGGRTDTQWFPSFRAAVLHARGHDKVQKIFARPRWTSGRRSWHKIAR